MTQHLQWSSQAHIGEEQLLPRHTSGEDYEVTTTSAAGTDDSHESSDSIPQGMGVNTNDQVATPPLTTQPYSSPGTPLNPEGHNGNASSLTCDIFLFFLFFIIGIPSSLGGRCYGTGQLLRNSHGNLATDL